MPPFEVHISEPPPVVTPASEPGALGSFVRGVLWSGEAPGEAAAIALAWAAWDDKYGPGSQPAEAIIRVAG